MKSMKQVLCFILCIIMLISCITSCSMNNADRVNPEELAVLREQYPYNNEEIPMSSSSYHFLQTWEELLSLVEIHAVVVLEFTGEWFTSNTPHSPIAGVKPEDLSAPVNSVTGMFHPAEIERILWGGEELKKGDTVDLFFGALWPLDVLEKTYQVQEKYVCFLFDYRENNYNIPSYGVEKLDTWHLTNQNVLIAASSHLQCIDDCSGMYLDAFETFINETFETYLPPDAELTPVEPEVETQ